jgi:hypothetical protein
METRKERIRRLQGQIAIEEMQKAILDKRHLWFPARQALLDSLKEQLEYEKKMELEELKNPPPVPPPTKNGNGSTVRKIIIGVVIAVIAGLIIYFLTAYVFS